MDDARIAELLQPFLDPCHSEKRSDEESAGLAPAQLASISTYIDILQRWNARINLTAIRDPDEIVTRHFGESLFAARLLFPARHVGTGHVAPDAVETAAIGLPAADARPPDSAPELARGRAALQGRVTQEEEKRALAPAPNDQRPAVHERLAVADIGAGAGFPGIPIKLWAPQISLTLIESNHKKATFLREVARALTLTDINIQNVRAESLPRDSFDVVTLRAVEQFASVLPTAAALVRPGGRLALLIGSSQRSQASSALPNLVWSDPIQIPSSSARILLIANKVA